MIKEIMMESNHRHHHHRHTPLLLPLLRRRITIIWKCCPGHQPNNLCAPVDLVQVTHPLIHSIPLLYTHFSPSLHALKHSSHILRTHIFYYHILAVHRVVPLPLPLLLSPGLALSPMSRHPSSSAFTHTPLFVPRTIDLLADHEDRCTPKTTRSNAFLKSPFICNIPCNTPSNIQPSNKPLSVSQHVFNWPFLLSSMHGGGG